MPLLLLISRLLYGVQASVMWAGYREMEATLLRGGGNRAIAAADQVASLLERSWLAGIEALRRVAADADVRRYVRDPNTAAQDAIRPRLMPLASAGNVRTIDVWSAAGSRLLEISIPAAAVPGVA